MFRSAIAPWALFATLVLAAAPLLADDAELATQVDELVAQLDADTISERDLAERNLLALVGIEGVGPEKFLAVLPKPNDNMPPAVRERLMAIRKQVETRLAATAVEPEKITLEAISWPLADVLAKLEELSGNKIITEQDPDTLPPEIILSVEDEPFWSVLDQVTDQAQLTLADYAGEDAVSLVSRPPNYAPRFGRADYDGPFRFEVLGVTATRGLRNPDNRTLTLNFEIAWEPRLRPIAITQQIERMDVMTAEGDRLAPRQADRVFNIEVLEGTCSTSINVPFSLPDRSVETISAITGNVTALVPGKREKFRFDDLAGKEPIIQSRGGVQITLERVLKNGAIWEVHMSLTLEDDKDALASHRGWAYNNLTYLVDEQGEQIDHAGFETIRQTPNEVGIAYFFDLPDLEGLSWVYESPVSIVEQDFKYLLQDIELP